MASTTHTSALMGATKLAWSAWEQVARQMGNEGASWELAAREAALWEIVVRLTGRIMLMTAWEDVRRPLDTEKRSWN